MSFLHLKCKENMPKIVYAFLCVLGLKEGVNGVK